MTNHSEGTQVGGSHFVQPMVGHGALQDAVAAHPSVAFAASARQMHLLRRNTQSQQMTPTGSRLLPLLPVVQPYPATNPFRQLDHDRIGAADAEGIGDV